MPKKEMTFELAINRLEELVKDLESDDAHLEDSIKSFEEGKKLIKFCLKQLDVAETKVKQLEETSSGEFNLTSF